MSDLERKMAQSDVPVQVIVAAFPDEGKADAALKQLQQLKKEHTIDILDAAIVRKDHDGKLHVKETHDMGGGRGAVIGGGVGTVLGLIAGPAGFLLATAGGALFGGLAAKGSDAGIPDERLRQLGDALTPGSSAIVAIIEHRWVEDVRREMARQGADVMTQEISADVHRQLVAGGTVGYTTVAGEGGVAAGRVASVGDQVEAQVIVVTPEGVAIGEMSTSANGDAGKDGPSATAANGAPAAQPQAAQPQAEAGAPAVSAAQPSSTPTGT